MANPCWDLFCQVVDNFGDIGVCWRLAVQLAGRGQAVRLWVDQPDALAWMAPAGNPGVQVRRGLDPGPEYVPGSVVVAAFGCPLAQTVVDALMRANQKTPASVRWINLEYLSAQPYAAQSHGLVSPVLGGAAAGVHKWFFFPGFTPHTGGVLREAALSERQARFDRSRWLAAQGIVWQGERVLSLFCYEPPLLADWLRGLMAQPTCLLVAAGRPQAALRAVLTALPRDWNARRRVRIHYLPLLAQEEFDHLLWAADANFVRGEDSLVRALWAGKGLVWQAYPQSEQAHQAKLCAFLDWLAPPESLRRYHRLWNGLQAGALPALDLAAWSRAVAAARQRLLGQEDLVTRLLRFVQESR